MGSKEFESRRKQLKDKLLLTCLELNVNEMEEGQLENLRLKARALSKTLEDALVPSELNSVEAGILALAADANRIRTAVEFG